MKSYTTQRLTLRPFRDDDVQAVYDYMGDHENTKFTRAGQQTLSDCADFIHSISDDEYIFGIEFSGRIIGTAELSLCEDSQAILGWIIHRDFWGRGFCTEAAAMLLHIAFDELNLRRVIAHCDSENTASVRVMEKLGMRREGVFIEARPPYKYAPDRHSDELSYAILASEYAAMRSQP